MKQIPLALAGLLAATTAFAQPAPPPTDTPPPPEAGPDGAVPAPPPRPGGPVGPRAARPAPPPPPRGASVHLAHGADGGTRLDVECTERDATRDCAEIAGQMLDRLNAPAKTK